MTTALTTEGLRKAAILVASLDTAAADAVLDQLTPEQAGQVRELVVELDNIDEGEQRRVIEEFFKVDSPRQSNGVELDGRLAWLASQEQDIDETDSPPPLPPSPPGRPFQFLKEAEAEKLVKALADERPQTIALVLSHLAPARAG